MKKTMIVLSALIALVACNKVETEQPTAKEYTYDITITRADDTKAVKSGWEDGDVVYVFFSNVEAPKYLKFTYDGSAWTRTQYNGATAESFTYPGNGNMTAIYLPYGNDAVVSADGTSFKFDKSYTSYYLKAEKAPYTVNGTVVSGTLSMEAPEGFVQFAMPISGTVHGDDVQFFRETAGAYTLKESHLTPCAFASVAADGTISNMTGVDYTAGKPITGYIYGGDINFSGVLSATSNGVAADYAFTFVNNNGTAETYDDVTYLLSGNKALSYKAAIKFPLISSSSWKVPEPEFVTVCGIKWAKWNVGATTETGYGDYFAWGAIYPQYKYEESDYQESAIAADLTDAKDVAYQKLGENWQMPTKDQLSALLSKISESTWTNRSGVNGHLIDPDTGHESEGSLFLPVAFSWSNEFHVGEFVQIVGLYWSSAYYDTHDAWFLCISSHNPFVDYCGSHNCGYSVRPVHN